MLTMGLAAYRRDLGAYPPDEVTSLGGSAEHGTSEALVHYLGRRLFKGPRSYGPYVPFSEWQLNDEDGDGFPEYRDLGGVPYLYVRRGDRPQDGGPRGYDLASPGPDGKLGGEMVPGKGYVPATTPEGKAAERDNITNW